MGLFSSKKTKTTTNTNVEDRRIGAEGGSTIAAEGGQVSTTFNLVDSDTGKAAVTTLRDVSKTALEQNASSLDRVLEFAAGATSRASEVAAGALEGAQATTAAALQKTASEQNQALETIVKGVMVVAGVYLAAQVLRS